MNKEKGERPLFFDKNHFCKHQQKRLYLTYLIKHAPPMFSLKASTTSLIIGSVVIVILAVGLYLTGVIPFKSTAPSADITVDSAADNANYLATAGSSATYTGRYLKEYDLTFPAPDQLELDEFIEQNRGPLYEPASPDNLNVSQARGSQAISSYLDFISGRSENSLQLITSESIEDGFNQLLDTGDPALLDQLIDTLEQNESRLRDTAIPVEATNLHLKIIGVTVSLRDNLTLMRDIDIDYVGGLIGARNTDDLSAAFDDIAFDIGQLIKKYDL